MLTQIQSRYLCKLYSVYESENSVYMVMELLSRSLLAYIQKYNFPGLDLCKELMAKLMLGLLALHKNGIMHRDLKL